MLEKSPLFARWKNKAKLAVITSLGCIIDAKIYRFINSILHKITQLIFKSLEKNYPTMNFNTSLYKIISTDKIIFN